MTKATPSAPSLAQIDQFYQQKLKSTARHGGVQPILSPDYRADDIPQWLEGTSFGCGNPVALSGIAPGDTVLDLGCGVGLDLLIAAQKTGPTGLVIGIDMSAAMVERARSNAQKGGFRNIEVLQGQLDALPLGDTMADWVVSNCVINLVPEKSAVFAEIARVLKPGGHMLISDIIAEDLPEWVALHADLYSACISSAVSLEDYLEAAAGAGLEALEVIDTLAYDDSALRHLVKEELPIALDRLAERLGLSNEAILAKVVDTLAGKVKAIKLWGRKPASP